MPKDYSERKLYRKSPGREYGYEHDPLRSRSEQKQRGQSGQLSTSGELTSRASTQLVQRPNLRRTRQLLRQNILASKARPTDEDEEQEAPPENARNVPQDFSYEAQEDARIYNRHAPSRSGRLVPPSEPLEFDEGEEEWQDFGDVDPDQGYEEAEEDPRERYVERPPVARSSRELQPAPTRSPQRSQRLPPVEVYDDEYDDEEDEGRKGGKRRISRRGILTGIGLVALGGAGVAAYELGPKIPGAIGNVGSNIEHQVQDAFNKGVTQGGEAARKAFINELDNLEGFSLQGAVAAAKLTRTAYDTFVSPIIKFGATLAADFLKAMLNGFVAARRILVYINQDNGTLQAIQKVLETWVADVNNMPTQLDAITDADLDGAQAYLHALQKKLDDERAKLNNPGAQTTPTPAKATATPKP